MRAYIRLNLLLYFHDIISFIFVNVNPPSNVKGGNKRSWFGSIRVCTKMIRVVRGG